MTEVTEWDNKPRFMWVWDADDEKYKIKEYVVYILSEKERDMKEAGINYPVITINSSYQHCAEIEEEKRLTNYELSQLLKCFGVEFYDGGSYSYNDKLYKIGDENEEVPKDHKIRYKQGEWEEPTRETVLKWWGEELPDSDIANFVTFLDWDKE